MTARGPVIPMSNSDTRRFQPQVHRASQLCTRMESALKYGQWHSATMLGESVLRCLPRHIWAECLLAQGYLAQGRLSQAQAYCASVLERDPESVVARLGLNIESRGAVAPIPSKGDDGATQPQTSAGHAPDEHLPSPGSLENSWRRAQNAWRLGRLTEAATEAQHMLTIGPRSLKAILLLADVAWQTGDTDAFGRWLRHAQELDPSGVVARRVWGSRHPLLEVLVFDPLCPIEMQDPPDKDQSAEAVQLDRQSEQAQSVWQESSVSAPDNPPWLLGPYPGSRTDLPLALSSPDIVSARHLPKSTKCADASAQVDEEMASIRFELARIAVSIGADDVSALLSEQPVSPGSLSLRSGSPNAPARTVAQSAPVQVWPYPSHQRGSHTLEIPWELIVSNRSRLVAKYGESAASRIDSALTELAKATTDEGRVRTELLYVDDEQSLATYGLTRPDPRVPEEMSAILRRIEERLSGGSNGDGARFLSYILLVGGDDIVPFHAMPNPSEDQDELVLSDHPYACPDSNPLALERSVGRLPDGGSGDPSYLLRLINTATEAHRRQQKQPVAHCGLLWQAISGWRDRADRTGATTSFGYSASIWRNVAREVFASIGSAAQLRTSPPLDSETMPSLGPIAPDFQYYNLHGLQDSASWYGHRDPTFTADYPQFPIAITPDNVPSVSIPQSIVFSEACYGAYTLGKDQGSSMALRLMEAQAIGLVGSTALAYGGIGLPLIGADLLARSFWELVMAGQPLGDALCLSKRALAQEMLARQGFLDPEDHKALLSFVLYGDPTLVAPARTRLDGVRATNGGAFTGSRAELPVFGLAASTPNGALLESTGGNSVPIKLCRQRVVKTDVVPSGLMTRVQHELSSYLPSFLWRDFSISAQAPCRGDGCSDKCDLCRALAMDESDPAAAKWSDTSQEWLPPQAELVFTLREESSANARGAQKATIHHQIAKVTVDGQGHLMKVAISR